MQRVYIKKDDSIKWNEEDLQPHFGVSAVIKGTKPGEVLLQKHVKLKAWTIPVGKARLDEDPESVMKRELKEECGINAKELELLGEQIQVSTRNGKVMHVPVKMFLVKKYEGKIKNTEPHKHSVQEFRNPHDLVLAGEHTTHGLRHYLSYLRESKHE